MGNFWKIIKYSLIVLILVVSANTVAERMYFPVGIKFGVTFSPKYAKYLRLNWQVVYAEILDDLKIKNIRIPSYWDVLEPQKEAYSFYELDYLLNEAKQRNAKIILVLGIRQPRWPECHVPAWAKNLQVFERQQKALELIQREVERYKDHLEVWSWQVENEPFASWFGQDCDAPDAKFLQEEISLVKKLDERPIIITDSGEWSSWIEAMKLSDILGISLYRKAYNEALSAYITYPFLNWMYPLKSNLVRKLFAPNNSKTIISEFQAEPWVKAGIPDTPLEKQVSLFTPADFKDNIEYAKKTGFDQAYLWGAEWWYFMAEQGHPEYLEYAKTLFR